MYVMGVLEVWCDFILIVCVCVLDQMRQYITQLRQETGVRLVEKVYGSGDQPSKVCNILPCVWYIYTHTITHIHYLLLPLAVVDMLH